MLSRRRFIGSGVAGSIVCGAVGSIVCGTARSAARAGAGATPGHAHLCALLFDERFDAAARFGRAAERHGLPARAVRADVTRIWYDELDPLWRRQPRPIAGLTAYAALFCLERLARSHGMRVVHHGTHTALASGAMQHVARGPWSAERLGPADWAYRLASRLASLERGSVWSRLPPVAVTAASTTSATAVPGQPLHSWIIAPVARELERT